MSTNIANALRIAGGMLLAILIVSVIVYTINKAKPYSETKASVDAAREVAEFNANYEAFNKKQMYGTDVISCINRVYSQNVNSRHWEITNGKFFSRSDAGVEAQAIKLTVKLKQPLETSVDAYAYDPDIHTEVKVGNASTYLLKSNVTLGDATSNPDEKEALKSLGISNMPISQVLSINGLKKDFMANEIILSTSTLGKSNDVAIRKIIKYPSLTIQNLNFSKDKNSNETWTRIHITTLAGDIKKRIFRCTNVVYNMDETKGRVGCISEIHFEEI